MREYLQRLIAWIKGELAKIRLFKFPNATIFGQPIIQDGQVSGFSGTNYLQFPFLVDFAGRPWQIDCEFTTGTDIISQQNILDSAYGLAFAIRNSKLVIALSSNGSTWNLGEHVSSFEIVAETTYLARISFDETKYVVAVSIDGGKEWIDYITYTSNESLAPKVMLIGTTTDGNASFGGSINMNKAYLTISGKVVWQGMDDAGLATRMAIDMSNIDEEGINRLRHLSAPSKGETADYTVEMGKIYNLGTVDGATITLAQTGLITNEVPCWHFYFVGGSASPAYAGGDGSAITIKWAAEETIEASTLYEVDIQQINGIYYGRIGAYE